MSIDTSPKRLRELASDIAGGGIWVRATTETLLALADEKEAQHQSEQHPEIADVLAVELAKTLAEIDGMEDEDLHELRWTGGASPEPIGDAWNMDYMPKGERLAKTVMQQRERMNARFTNRAPSPPTADFDLPHESDDVSAQPEQHLAMLAEAPLPETVGEDELKAIKEKAAQYGPLRWPY